MFSAEDPIFQVIKMDGHSFPGIWKYILPEDFSWFRVPREKLCACDVCYEVAVHHFDEDCRCCNHLPQVPNFSLGLALLNPRCRDLVLSVIESRQSLPEGIRPTPAQYAASVEAYSKDLFGKSKELNCVFMDPQTKLCRVYEVRNGICATFFCQNDHGPVGQLFWESVLDLVVQLEFALELWCMEQLGMAPAAYMKKIESMAADIGGVSDPVTGKWAEHAYQTIWGDFAGREVEFYEACANLVMDHRDHLFEIGREQPLLRPIDFEQQERLSISREHRHEAPRIPTKDYTPISIADLWYKLQVVYRRLTAIPFGEGTFALDSDAHLEPWDSKELPLPVLEEKTHVVWKLDEAGKKDSLYLSPLEKAALERFRQPRIIGEELLQTSEFVALEDPREFLAICLRRGFLSVA